MPYFHISLQKCVPLFLVHVDIILINRFHTQLSYWLAGVEDGLSIRVCVRNWRYSSNLRIEKSAGKKLTFVALGNFPITLRHLFCIIWRF
jgi:hypothetical protein